MRRTDARGRGLRKECGTRLQGTSEDPSPFRDDNLLAWGMAATLERVKAVLRTSLKLDAGAELADEMPLVGGEYDLDSLDILLIVTNIEKEFGIKVREGTMDRKAFATVKTLAEFVAKVEAKH